MEGFFFLLPSEDFPIASLLMCILLISSMDLFTTSSPPFSWMPLLFWSWSNPIPPSHHSSLPPQLLPGRLLETGMPLLSLCFTQPKNPTTFYFPACKTGFPFLESSWQPSPVPAPGWIRLIWTLVTRSMRSIASRDSPQEKKPCRGSLLPFLDNPCLIHPWGWDCLFHGLSHRCLHCQSVVDQSIPDVLLCRGQLHPQVTAEHLPVCLCTDVWG